MIWLVLVSLKWLLLGFVAVLGAGKVVAWCASWTVNHAFAGQ